MNIGPISSQRTDQALDYALVGDRLYLDPLEVTSNIAAIDVGGPWVVVLPYDGPPICVRFARTLPASEADSILTITDRPAPDIGSWSSSLDQRSFMDRVQRIRQEIAGGRIDQTNLTRVIRAPIRGHDDPWALARVLMSENPAPFSAAISLSDPSVKIISASPELFLSRDGRRIRSSPIKGTASTSSGFLPKDESENVLVTESVHRELDQICEVDSVGVTDLLRVEQHPGLFHLVSTVEGTLRSDCKWTDIIATMFPPASVTGVPKSESMSLISELEPVGRRFYCGTIGWVEDDGNRGELSVAIRTFWIEDGYIHFGTGGGITPGSDPLGEWEETELKAHKLVGVVSRAATSTEEHR